MLFALYVVGRAFLMVLVIVSICIFTRISRRLALAVRQPLEIIARLMAVSASESIISLIAAQTNRLGNRVA